MKRLAAILIALTLLVAGCSVAPLSTGPETRTTSTSAPSQTKTTSGGPTSPYTVMGKTYHRLSSAEGFTEVGYASWYGDKFHGKLTASGEPYDMYGRTAAHKTLPLGTWVKVTRLDSGATITTRINDRGPFVEGRIIDLSNTLAKELDMIQAGTAKVRIVAVDKAGNPLTGTGGSAVAWQVGSFTNGDNAANLAAQLRGDFGEAQVVKVTVNGTLFNRVWVGRYDTTDEADAAYARLRNMDYKPIPVTLQ